MSEKKKKRKCWKSENPRKRNKLLGNIDLKTFRGAYGVKSCRCACSCGDGY